MQRKWFLYDSDNGAYERMRLPREIRYFVPMTKAALFNAIQQAGGKNTVCIYTSAKTSLEDVQQIASCCEVHSIYVWGIPEDVMRLQSLGNGKVFSRETANDRIEIELNETEQKRLKNELMMLNFFQLPPSTRGIPPQEN
ncbi:unnamed protein product [Didymodactylos carnosus]|uniref:Uncharacterized protein n=1 Tax=Didymodactylos carnosus TaxID=1234261 RepID=A0A816BSH0_9BILA|nr:unnamed protein product [Didymodactylos carnosus]CAF1612881.1 unnamed protein product [Didymodactylos carnosus]CAF3808397.1 unnamed protein product [Didymodactylos carnosus]CAF4497271.1 unnamed protein product [Didymodactylos carnosus]